jgi:hypothetical protein
MGVYRAPSGILHCGKTIYVMFDPECQEWLFTDEEGKELRRRPAPEIMSPDT